MFKTIVGDPVLVVDDEKLEEQVPEISATANGWKHIWALQIFGIWAAVTKKKKVMMVMMESEVRPNTMQLPSSQERKK